MVEHFDDETESPPHAVIILAAGASRRLGTAKQLLEQQGELLLQRSARLARDTQPAQTLVVLGHDADRIFATISGDNVQRVDCPDWQQGMSASLRAGIVNVAKECRGALILLCDQMELTAHHLNLICRTWRQQPDRAVASAYANTLGVPALLPRAWFDRVTGLRGDQGARALLRGNPDVVSIGAPELVRDVDTTQDLAGYFS